MADQFSRWRIVADEMLEELVNPEFVLYLIFDNTMDLSNDQVLKHNILWTNYLILHLNSWSHSTILASLSKYQPVLKYLPFLLYIDGVSSSDDEISALMIATIKFIKLYPSANMDQFLKYISNENIFVANNSNIGNDSRVDSLPQFKILAEKDENEYIFGASQNYQNLAHFSFFENLDKTLNQNWYEAKNAIFMYRNKSYMPSLSVNIIDYGFGLDYVKKLQFSNINRAFKSPFLNLLYNNYFTVANKQPKFIEYDELEFVYRKFRHAKLKWKYRTLLKAFLENKRFDIFVQNYVYPFPEENRDLVLAIKNMDITQIINIIQENSIDIFSVPNNDLLQLFGFIKMGLLKLHFKMDHLNFLQMDY